MEFVVYILKSKSKDYYYVGMTSNLIERFRKHNNGWEKTTKPYRPFEVIHVEFFESRIEARKREKFWKNSQNKKVIISQWID